jgi:hypothetical protein
MSLGGTNPACRLKLYVTGRQFPFSAELRRQPMQAYSVAAFDEFISGTTGVWSTPATYNEPFGTADGIVVYATTTDVSGVGPVLTCQIEHSGNGTDWNYVQSSDQLIAQPIYEEATLAGSVFALLPPMLKFVRVTSYLGGTSPACRLKIHVVGTVHRFPAT